MIVSIKIKRTTETIWVTGFTYAIFENSFKDAVMRNSIEGTVQASVRDEAPEKRNVVKTEIVEMFDKHNQRNGVPAYCCQYDYEE